MQYSKFGKGEGNICCPYVCDWLTYTTILKCKLHDTNIVWKPMFSIYI